MLESDSSKEKIRRYITRIKDLPTLPIVVTQILKLVNQDSSSAKELGQAVASDQALAANVLKLANSTFYGFSRKISTITEAIVHLGFNVVRCLAVSVSVIDVFSEGEDRQYFNRSEFWQHSIGCGIISKMTAQRVKNVDPEIAFLVGILHDLGKLALDRFMVADFNQVLKIANEQEMTFSEAEQRYYDTDHAQIGAWLADWWKLPSSIVEPILRHHKTENIGAGSLVAIVAFANALCHHRDIGNSGYQKKLPLNIPFWESLGFNEDLLNFIDKNIDAELERAEIFTALAT